MKLIIKGFKKQNIIEIEDVIAVINQVPTHHKHGITTIVYDPGRFYQRSYYQTKPINYSASGEYNSIPIDHVIIYKFSSYTEFRHIVLHEIGHHVFKRIMSSVQRKTWVTEIYPNKDYVSSYAKTNAHEDFAECYASFYTNHESLRKISTKYHYIKKIMLAKQ